MNSSKITLSPLPDIKILLKSIFFKKNASANFSHLWGLNDSMENYWFSRSTFSILAIANWYETFTGENLESIWFPDYFCNEALTLLRSNGHPIFFYPIRKNLEPDWIKCEELLSIKTPNIFFLVHYFGNQSDLKTARHFCNNNSIVLVEDATHVSPPISQIGSAGEFTLYSPHKTFSIPDGGLLIQKRKTKVTRRISKKNPAEVMKKIILKMPAKSEKPYRWLIKKNIQKVLPDFFWKKNFYLENSEYHYPFKKDYSKQSHLSKRLLFNQLDKIEDYSRRRKINFALLRASFESKDIDVIFKNKKFTPYLIGLIFKNESTTIKYYQSYKKNLLPIIRWPDIPPEILDDNQKKYDANDIKKRTLFLPVHQSLNIKTIRNIMIINARIDLNQKNKNKYLITRFTGNQIEWNVLFNMIKIPNFMQSWEYGEAKKNADNWSVKRFIIKKDDTIIALFQLLEKKFLFFKLCRINRGPLILEKYNNFEIKRKIFKAIKNHYSIKKGCLLFIGPELESRPINNGLMELSNMVRRNLSYGSWKSILIDLSQKEEDIRSELNGKWRNQLTKVEKKGLKLNISNSNKSYEEILKNYKQLSQEHSFSGNSIKFYKILKKVCSQNLFVFSVELNTKVISRILIIKHGDVCIYQIGWNSDEGRKIYSGNFIIWGAILKMKALGCKWFDLGGLDPINNSGITKFKRGLGGREYSLVGEYISF
tara:strand:- start:13889 stop:16012 length:2124 start_codon:yes stop_codon:yes gene_type:complete